jgi:uncharacterized protein
MPKELQVKNFGFEVKAVDESTFEGYAAVFRNVDSYRDVIEPGAFSKTIKESKRVKVLWQHDPWQPIGKPITMEEDNHGLYVKAKVAPTSLGKDVMELMRSGVIDEMSIGFNTIKDEWDNEKNVRRIKEVKLWEFSPVTFAANDQALITDAKGITPALARLQGWVDDELKAGKVLSEKNKSLVNNAIEALTALLTASEGKNVEPPQPGTHKLSEDEQKAANDIKAMLEEMSKFNK